MRAVASVSLLVNGNCLYFVFVDLNIPNTEQNGGSESKCSKLLSKLISNQAESTASTMKILSNLLKDDGCSLSPKNKK